MSKHCKGRYATKEDANKIKIVGLLRCMRSITPGRALFGCPMGVASLILINVLCPSRMLCTPGKVMYVPNRAGDIDIYFTDAFPLPVVRQQLKYDSTC